MQQALTSGQTSKPGAAGSMRAAPQRSVAPHGMSNHRFLKAKARDAALAISEPGDVFEQEADRIAEQVMRMPQPAPPVAAADEPVVQRRATHQAAPETIPPIVHDALRSPGRPLDAAARAFMEPRFGRDLSAVRVHTDGPADAASRSINARAFTLGSDIAFAHGEYRPGSSEGRRLIAHELTHVEQQGGVQQVVQRAMKFEFQVSGNRIYKRDGANKVSLLPRKFGPEDYLAKGATGVRLESETDGKIEFETGWERTWGNLSAQITEAQEMAAEITKVSDVTIDGTPYKKFPFNVDHLRGHWVKNEEYEDNSVPGRDDRPLNVKQDLFVKIGDPKWWAYIQPSESFLLSQYESYLKQQRSRSI